MPDSPVYTGVSAVELRIASKKMDVGLFKQIMEDTNGKLEPRHITMLKQHTGFLMPDELTEPAFCGGVQVTE